MRPVSRPIAPLGPATAYKTYAVASPRDTRVKTACEQAGCLAWRQGWTTTVDEGTDMGRSQAAYIRRRSGRTFREQRTAAGLTVFRFESGQRCFRDHHTRPEIFWVRGGDWRGNPLDLRRRHANGRDWTEDFALHQGRIADRQRKG